MTFQNDDNEKETFKEILRGFLPPIIENLLHDGILDISRKDDLVYVRETVLANTSIIEELRATVQLDESIMKAARDVRVAGHSEATIILVATVIEHRINMFVRNILEINTDLSESMIVDVIKNSLHANLSWIWNIITKGDFPADLSSKILRLAELRNSIVHYKVSPVENIDKFDDHPVLKRLKEVDLDDILTLPEQLAEALDELLLEIRPFHRISKEITKALLGE